jgi:predicted ester cyclase
MYDFSENSVREALAQVFAPDAVIHMGHPMGDMAGPKSLYDRCYGPLFAAIPDLERRDTIVVAGTDADGAQWVGCAGSYVGTFVASWLDIPPTGHMAHMRFHEFYRVESDRIVELQAIWDIPELMMQANAWPMAPGLGQEGLVPGPATQDGVTILEDDPVQSKASCDMIIDMLTQMTRHPSQGGPEVMEMERFWHPRMTWYGPAGIGTCRGIAGFRNWHQIPFLWKLCCRNRVAKYEAGSVRRRMARPAANGPDDYAAQS